VDIILAVAAVIAALVAVATLIYAIKSGREQAERLAAQTKNIFDQTELLRKQVFSEVYDEAKIRNLRFYLPERRKRPVAGFEGIQKEREEVDLGKEVKVGKESEIELHVQFWMDAPQKLRALSWGFVDSFGRKERVNHPTIPRLQRAFKVKETSHFEREIYMDWHGHWHMEFPFPRFLPKDECYVLCFIVKSNCSGKFPLAFNIRTEEAKNPYTESLWVEVVS